MFPSCILIVQYGDGINQVQRYFIMHRTLKSFVLKFPFDPQIKGTPYVKCGLVYKELS